MTDLVTDAAIDAVMRWLPNFVTYTDDGLERARYTTRRNLETAAPFIAAEALRQAAKQLDGFEKESRRDGYVVAVDTAVTYLSGKADELEADAEFTGMVQQGQEIGEE